MPPTLLSCNRGATASPRTGTGWENVTGRLMAVRWSASSCPGLQFTEGYQYDTGLLTIKRLYTPTLGTNSYIDASFTYTPSITTSRTITPTPSPPPA